MWLADDGQATVHLSFLTPQMASQIVQVVVRPGGHLQDSPTSLKRFPSTRITGL